MKNAVISQATAADYTIVAAVSGAKIRVKHYTVASAGTATITWKSATTALSGAMSLATASNI
jgi:hypothetical protein